jgi:SNF2 family DNA or RNA helicase
MLYKGKAIEIIGTKEVFGEEVAWIRILESGEFLQVGIEELTQEQSTLSLAYVRFIALATKIKAEVARKNILAPYESSLIPLPHQVLVLEKVMQSSQNRFLLADEVGMGKTIETGLILKELKLRGDIHRILVIVPKSSMLQWQSELKDHFNEMFHIYDSEIITSLARTFANINADQEFNFWTQHNQIIVSTDALKPLERRQGWPQERVDEYNKFRMQSVLEADFDMVIIDEAHKMGGATAQVSRYILAQALCNAVANVLLLTATPHRGKADHFRRILQLLDPDAFAGEGLPDIDELEPYVIRTEKRLAVDYDGKKLFNERKTTRFDVILDLNKHAQQMALYDAVTDYVRRGFNTAQRRNNAATGLIMILFQRLVSSSTAAILSAMQGRLTRLRSGDDQDIEAYADDWDISEDDYAQALNLQDDISTSPDLLVDEESILVSLIEQAIQCRETEVDAKAEALLDKIIELQQTSKDTDLKVLVFAEFRTTQAMLKEFLESEGYAVSIINGTQDLDARKKALIDFKNNAQILIGTDAAGESLNMQFCHIVINYDLPWNPMMIEQRIGRVDRIGQKNTVQAFNMLTNNSVDLRVYEVIEEKLGRILSELGIDKTSDVLDSAIDMQQVNQLYLQSLLNPEDFSYSGDRWLRDIKAKLRDYQSTEGILPEIKDGEIDYKKANEIKYSPLPLWLEELVLQHVKVNGGSAQKSLDGSLSLVLNGERKDIAFDIEAAINHPSIEHVTLQHGMVRKLLNDIGEFNLSNGIPILGSTQEETAGLWSLWEVSAHNHFENKVSYECFFISEDGRFYSAYANDIWSRLLKSNNGFSLNEIDHEIDFSDLKAKLKDPLYSSYQELTRSVKKKITAKRENKLNSFKFRKTRIERIGIENIRESKLKKLESEKRQWEEEFSLNQKIVPNIRHLLSLKIIE